MQMTLRLLLLLAALLLSSAGAMADDEFSLLVLHKICTSDEAPAKSACAGFMAGFVGGLRVGTNSALEGRPICLPSNISFEQLSLILDKIYRDGPQYLNLPAAPAFGYAVGVAFRCPK